MCTFRSRRCQTPNRLDRRSITLGSEFPIYEDLAHLSNMKESEEQNRLPELYEKLIQRKGGAYQLNKQGTLELLRSQLAAGSANTPEELNRLLKSYIGYAESILKASPKLRDFDWDRNPIHISEIESCLNEFEDRKETLAVALFKNSSATGQQINEESAKQAALLMHLTSTMYYSLYLSEDSFIDTLWQGAQVNSLKRLLKTWNQKKVGQKEEFWQTQIKENPAFICQVLPYPTVIFQDKAFVGGKAFNNVGGKEVDFLLQNSLTKDVALLEIKTPETKLLGSEYRGTYAISADLAGAVSQVLAYRDKLLKKFDGLYTDHIKTGVQEIDAFNPTCLVLTGNIGAELTSADKKKALELFRNELNSVSIISFDELFGKATNLLNLFE